MIAPTITERIKPLMYDAVMRIAPTEAVTGWDYSTALLPTPDGLISFSVITIQFKSPLLGQPDMAHTDVRPLSQLVLSQETIDFILRNSVEGLRQARAEILKGTV